MLLRTGPNNCGEGVTCCAGCVSLPVSISDTWFIPAIDTGDQPCRLAQIYIQSPSSSCRVTWQQCTEQPA